MVKPTWFEASGPDTVIVPESLRETFARAQENVREYFSRFRADPATGRIEISDERYVLVRASALSTDFFDSITHLYHDRDPAEAAAIGRSFLFDIAHTVGKNDARAFHKRMELGDPIAKLAAGPVHFSYSGWALVDVDERSAPSPDDDYLMVYDHPYSFEADTWLRSGRTSDSPVCIMNAGYSSGWCEESFGVALTAVEVACKACGDDNCTFVMAPPDRVGEHLRALYPDRAATVTVPTPFERKREEDALRRSEKRLRSILAATPMPVLITREDGTLVYANDPAREVFALDSERAAVSALFERTAVLDELFRATAAGEEIVGREQVMVDGAGQPFSALVSCHPILLPGGDGGMVVTALDVTDYKRTEAALRVNERMATVGTMAAGVAHEVNNPLSYVIANLERVSGLVAGGELDPAKLSGAIDQALEGARRVRDIVKDLRSLSRDHPADVIEAVDVEAVLDSAISMASVEWRHRAEVVRDYAGVPAIRGNSGRLGQVLLNLLVNAAQAIVEGAASANRITATTRLEGDRVVISISDTGTGVSDAELARIFDPFFTTKGVGEGTGLGLAISRNIVTDLGGEITAESNPGRGTTVTVSLPASEADSARPDVTGPGPELDSLSILIVDDEEPLIDVLTEMLAECEVTVATSGRAARDKLGDRHFDVVLCDLMMPDVTGMELYRTVSEDVRDRMIFMTGGAFTSSAASFLEGISNPCLEKPIEMGALREAIRVHVSSYGG